MPIFNGPAPASPAARRPGCCLCLRQRHFLRACCRRRCSSCLALGRPLARRWGLPRAHLAALARIGSSLTVSSGSALTANGRQGYPRARQGYPRAGARAPHSVGGSLPSASGSAVTARCRQGCPWEGSPGCPRAFACSGSSAGSALTAPGRQGYPRGATPPPRTLFLLFRRPLLCCRGSSSRTGVTLVACHRIFGQGGPPFSMCPAAPAPRLLCCIPSAAPCRCCARFAAGPAADSFRPNLLLRWWRACSLAF